MFGVCAAPQAHGFMTTSGRSQLQALCALQIHLRTRQLALLLRLRPRDSCTATPAVLHRCRRLRAHTKNADFQQKTRVHSAIRCDKLLPGWRGRPLPEQSKAAIFLPASLTRCLPSVVARHCTPPMPIATFLAWRARAWRAAEAGASSHVRGLLTHCELQRLRFACSSDFDFRRTGHHSALTVCNRSPRDLSASARRSTQVRT